MIDASASQLLLMVLTGWLARREGEIVKYLIEENRCLRRQLGTKHVRLTDDDRRHPPEPRCRTMSRSDALLPPTAPAAPSPTARSAVR